MGENAKNLKNESCGTFAEVLKDKLKGLGPDESAPSYASDGIETQDLFGKVWSKVYTFRPQRVRYQAPPRPSKSEQTVREPQAAAPAPETRSLTKEESAALRFFTYCGENESEILQGGLKKAYRRLAKELHPDAHIGASDSQLQRWTTHFQKLKRNYDILKQRFK